MTMHCLGHDFVPDPIHDGGLRTHALAATMAEALACKASGEDKVIVTALCGYGLLDLAAYEAYLSGRMVDSGLSDADLAAALAAVPVLAG